MSNLSEEEIINHFDKMCVLDENCIGIDCLDEKDLEAIRGLLDLYNKEKEKNKELEKEKVLNEKILYLANNTLCNYYEGYQAGLHKEITATEIVAEERERFIIGQEIKRLKDTIHKLHNQLDEGNKRVKEDYISKDKIKEKMEKLEDIRMENLSTQYYGTVEQCENKIEVLEELLKE